MNIDAIHHRARSGVAPPAAEKVNAVTARREPAEYLMEMMLCATRLRVLTVLPVQDEDTH
jgi:hypothetical protein